MSEGRLAAIREDVEATKRRCPNLSEPKCDIDSIRPAPESVSRASGFVLVGPGCRRRPVLDVNFDPVKPRFCNCRGLDLVSRHLVQPCLAQAQRRAIRLPVLLTTYDGLSCAPAEICRRDDGYVLRSKTGAISVPQFGHQDVMEQ